MLLLKKKLPKAVVEKLRIVKGYFNSYRLFELDRKRFLTYFSKKNSNKEENIKAQLIFYGHSIEKGLSRQNIRLGFGKSVVIKLLEYMEKYDKLGFDKQNYCYLNSISIMRKYIEFHEQNYFDLDYIPIRYNGMLNKIKESNTEVGGIVEFDLKSRLNRKEVDFKYLALNRYSIRDYDSSNVDLVMLNEAIEIALKSPSVCNRQSARVYVINDKTEIKELLNIQGGFNGYELPPCLILVTSDIQDFIDISERNQPYIDGGIFAMSLIYALEYQGFATCTLNTMFDSKKMKKTRNLLGIPESENLIVYISVGNFKNKYSVPKSFRYPMSEITKYR
ncbi:nitroreductase family protein [Enterococcus faecalis]|uniref:nitroreductase family protein n=1 Tax=Enterococcus faecalis TaxID=1351 RepID=UPI0025B01517|nr:nitroreductase family protein [Enterococcus faecalis]